MSAADVLEAIDVSKEGKCHLITGRPSVRPDQFGFEGFEEGLDGRVVVTVTLAAHLLPGKRFLTNAERGCRINPWQVQISQMVKKAPVGFSVKCSEKFLKSKAFTMTNC